MTHNIIFYYNMNQFKIIHKLGEGSFGIVYKVVRKTDHKQYALKQINLQKMGYEEKNNALNEVRLLASLNHPHVVKFLEAFPVHSGNYISKLCIVMEFADGGDLSSRIKECKRRNRRISLKTLWKYATQLTDALQYLHSHNIMHRDIKAANCFLTKDDSIKVGDMNISKIIKNGQLARTKIGTPYYMSPEIWKNRPYDYKCDVWSVGCLLYELAALKVPFEGMNIHDLSIKILNGRYQKRPSNYYDSSMWNYIESMLKVQPSSRPSMSECFKKAKTHIEYNTVTKKPIIMLKTIKMIPNVRQLSDRLPKPQYNANTILPPIKEQVKPQPKPKPSKPIDIKPVQHKQKPIKPIDNKPIYNKPISRKPKVNIVNSPYVNPIPPKKNPPRVKTPKSDLYKKINGIQIPSAPEFNKNPYGRQKTEFKKPSIHKLLGISKRKSPSYHWPIPGFKWYE